MDLTKLAKRYRIDKPKGFALSDFDTKDTGGLAIDKQEARALLAEGVERLAKLQERLYAQDRWAVLVIFQAMDAAGKDSTIKHVMSGINPQGCQVHSFKAPSTEELDHDFLWRAASCLPERGRIGIFNRSYYEEVLVVRVHPELLERQRLPGPLVHKKIWKQRFQDIRGFEEYLGRNGVAVIKFHLRISKEEQRQRFLARLEDPAKRWKFSMDDVAERARWDDYTKAYEDMIRNTSTAEAPWYVVPNDQKWFGQLVVAAVMVETLERLDLAFPKVEGKALAEMNKVRDALLADAPARGKGKRAR